MIPTKLIIGGIGALAIGLVIYFGYLYVTNLQQENGILKSNNKALEISNEKYAVERTQLKEDLAKNIEESMKLYEEIRNAREQQEKMVKLFADHNFTELVSKKPGLIQSRMNKATDAIFKELENASR